MALLYAVVGQSLLAAKLLNVVVGVFTVGLLYKLGHQVGGPLVARVTICLFLFWPAQLMFTSVLASEHLTLLALVAAFDALLSVIKESRKAVRMAILTGGLFGLATTFRYPCLIVLPAVLVCIFLADIPVVARVWRGSALIGGFLLIFSLYSLTMYAIYKQAPSFNNSFNLLIGTNYEADGQLNEENGRAYGSFSTPEEANRYARATALERIKKSPFRFFKLMGLKISNLWRDELYAPYFSTVQLTANQGRIIHSSRLLFISSQLYYVWLLAMGFVGSLVLIKRKGNKNILPLLAGALSITFLHAVVISTPHYHYVIIPTIIILDSLFLIYLMKSPSGVAIGKPEPLSSGNR